ncbi:MAG: biopolymer transporter Tol [Spirulinaceae cyanobacterium]
MLSATNYRIFRLIPWGINLSLIVALTACNSADSPQKPATLNSRYNDEQPALSGDGRLLAFVSNRKGHSQIALYDLKRKQLINLPGLNEDNTITQNPSLSLTGRYIVYISSDGGRPTIYLYDRITEKAEVLSRNYRSWVRSPNISPDGRYVVFESARRGQWDVEILDRGPGIELDIVDGTSITGPE